MLITTATNEKLPYAYNHIAYRKKEEGTQYRKSQNTGEDENESERRTTTNSKEDTH